MAIKAKKYLSAIFASSVLFAGTASAQLESLPSSFSSIQVPFKSEVAEAQSNTQSPITVSSGAYASSGVSPTLYNTGIFRFLNLPVVGSVPSSAKVNVVNYYYNYSSTPAGMIAYLCWNDTNNCVNVSNNKSGRLTQFGNKAANKSFFFAFGVSGNGSALPRPIYGGKSQVIVNYGY